MRRQTQQLWRRKLPNNYDIKNINSHFTKRTKTTKPMTGHINHVNKAHIEQVWTFYLNHYAHILFQNNVTIFFQKQFS